MISGIPRRKEFPADNRFWRVDWYGAIQHNPNIPSEPYLQIIIRPLNDNNYIHLRPSELASIRTTAIDRSVYIFTDSSF